MINILSIKCGLAFAPYLEESAREFLSRGQTTSRVVRQGGSGLIIRSDENMKLRYQNRECDLGPDEARHYRATIVFRREIYDMLRMSDEVVLGSVGNQLLLSHPQSEIWLEPETVSSLLDYAEQGQKTRPAQNSPLPDWLNLSSGAGRLLLSDQRSGRWVLLGEDHLAEMKKRFARFQQTGRTQGRLAPPAVNIKGINMGLQSAFHFAECLERFAETGEIEPYEETYGGARLRVARSSEGVEIDDGNLRAGMNRREARKWAGILRSELERLNARQSERGRIRTVFADGHEGRWVLQWGDEVFAADDTIESIRTGESAAPVDRMRRVVSKQADDLLILLDQVTGSCVALNERESESLFKAQRAS
ncbi:MAG TPA: hypothetical protein VFQ92_02025 [Blastocatellia bacterium]|nr:hypothetical protein [Blastocatellia bacterium]